MNAQLVPLGRVDHANSALDALINNYAALGPELQTLTGLAGEEIVKGCSTEEGFYQLLHNAVARGRCTAAAVVELLGRYKIHFCAKRLAELPRWREIISDPGGAVAVNGVRDIHLAIVCDAPAAGDTFSPCYAVTTREHYERMHVSERAQYAVKARSAKYRIAGWVFVPEDLIGLLYAEWDRRSGGADVTEATDSQALFLALTRQCFLLGASDIHITIEEGASTQVRARVDGRLEYVRELPEEVAKSMLMAAYNSLAEEDSISGNLNFKLRQDASITCDLVEGKVKLRYSGLPLYNGYDATLRINTSAIEGKSRAPSELGYSADQLEEIHRAFAHSSGMILFVGTTGSGKTESLASMLSFKSRNSPGKLIRTLEEPVEVAIEGARQTPFSRGGDFNEYMRQLLRSDPDTIAIAEIRDPVTANLAISAVRSGHLLPSTLHVNDALGAFERLVGLGVPRSDIAGTGLVRLVVHQRLLPLVCSSCGLNAEQAAGSQQILDTGVFRRLENAGIDTSGLRFESPHGCEVCSHRGRKGRTLAAEIVKPTLGMLRAVLDARAADLYALWRATRVESAGVMTGRTAFEHALHKMQSGLVSPLGVEEAFHMIDDRPYQEGE